MQIVNASNDAEHLANLVEEGFSCRIGEFAVEPSRNLIKYGDNQFSIEPRIMDVLCALAERQGEVIARTDLIERLWDVKFGGDESLSRAISQLRKTFRAAGCADEYIETIPKRGYRLVQPFHGVKPETGRLPKADAVIEKLSAEKVEPQPRTSSYSVAVMPLDSSGGQDERFLAADIGHDLVAMISRAPNLRVPAYDSALKHQTKHLDVGKLGKLLNVQYVVSGSLIRQGDRLKLRIGLVNSTDLSHIMSWCFKEEPDRFIASLDDFILHLSTSIVNEVRIAEATLAHTREESDRNAYEIVLSTEMLRTVYSQQRAQEIVEHLERLIKREPNNAVAHGSLAIQLAQNVTSGWTNAPAAVGTEARKHIDTALALAPSDPDVLTAAGIVAAMRGDMQSAIHHLTRSLEYNPSNPHCLAVLGWQKCLLNGDEQGIAMIRTAERRAPRHPRYPIWAYYRAMCEIKLRRTEEAVAAYRQAIDRNPNYMFSHLMLSAQLAVLNRDDEARAAIERALALVPTFAFQQFSKLMTTWAHSFHDLESKEECVDAVRRVWPS